MSDLFFDDDDRHRGRLRYDDGPAGDRLLVEDDLDDDDVVYVEADGGGAGRWLALLGVVVLLGVGALVVAGLWLQRQVDPPGGPGEEVALTVPQGASTAAIADLLAAEDVVTDSQIFQYYLRLNGGGPFQAGEYVLARNMAMGDVVDVLEEGPSFEVAGRVTVPEGLTLEEVIELVGRHEAFDEQAFRTAVEGGAVRSRYQPEGAPLEGLLLPETYTLDGREDETALLRRMVEAFDASLDELGYGDAEARVGLSPYEVVIVASLVEAEAKVDEERPRISRVIHNRLDTGMTLGIDATFYYALGRRGGSLTQSELEIDSPYNTRQHVGLVPTPIGAAGRPSLEAAIAPEEGPWLFYVLQDPLTHSFSVEYDDFLADRRRAQEQGLIP
jgi:UPF0755 protein